MCLVNNFSKKSDALDPQVFHMMTFKTSMKKSYLVATDTKQTVDKSILLDVLVCSIAEYFSASEVLYDWTVLKTFLT